MMETITRTEFLHQDWDSSAWVNYYKSSYTYDGNNNQIEWLSQSWDGSAWMNYYKYSSTYDGNNNQIECLSQSWWLGSAWVNEYKDSYTYIPVTAVNDDLSFVGIYSLSNNYPNPFNPSTKLSYSIIQAGLVILNIYDVLGNEIETLVNEERPAGTYEINWNAANVPSGVYFYQLKAGDYLNTKKMILLK